MLIGAWRKGKRCQVGGAISPGHVSRCHFAARRYFAKHLFMLFWTARVPPNALTGVGKIYKHPSCAPRVIHNVGSPRSKPINTRP